MSSKRNFAASLGLAALIFYLGANAFTGEDGLISFFGLQAREAKLKTRLHGLEQRRALLADRVARLRPDSLDLDFLEERARALLAARRPGEHTMAYVQ